MPTSSARGPWGDIPQVILSEDNPDVADSRGRREHLRKPFQYRDLVRKIEGLLSERSE
ncbi:MAG: hypothetical protein U0903_19695 [Planctomycetales bacterium]